MTGDKSPTGQTGQGLGAQGPGNAHGAPADHEPDTEGKPFDPRGGQAAADPEAAAESLLRQSNTGQPANDDAGPMAAGERDEPGKA